MPNAQGLIPKLGSIFVMAMKTIHETLHLRRTLVFVVSALLAHRFAFAFSFSNHLARSVALPHCWVDTRARVQGCRCDTDVPVQGFITIGTVLNRSSNVGQGMPCPYYVHTPYTFIFLIPLSLYPLIPQPSHCPCFPSKSIPYSPL